MRLAAVTITFGYAIRTGRPLKQAVVHVVMRSGYLIERIACGFEIVGDLLERQRIP